MRRKITLKNTAALFYGLFFSILMHAQNEITIGTGTSSGNFYPIATYYNSSATEALYLGSEINASGSITKIAYDKASGNSTEEPEVRVYMKTTDKTSHGNSDYALGWAEYSQYTQVYQGRLQNHASSGWMEIVLDVPFSYPNQLQNLSVLVVGKTCISSGRPQYRQTTTGSQRLLGAFDDGQIGCDGSLEWNEYENFKPKLERPNIKLIFSSLSTNERIPQNAFVVYKENGSLTVKSSSEKISEVALFDTSGRLIDKKQNADSKEIYFNNIAIKNQLLIVKITSQKNKTATKKVVF